MTCCGDDAVQVSKMAMELKSGPMLLYKRRIFGRDWRDVYVVLYNDSTLIWYKDKSLTEQEGGVIVKDAPELMAYGQYTNMIPNRPELPENYTIRELTAFGSRGKENVYWLLCPSDHDVISWMTAISNTLPPPPQPPQPTQAPQQQPSEAPMLDTATMLGRNPSAPPQPQSYMPPPATPAGIPGQYPQPGGYQPPPYTTTPLQAPYPYSMPMRSPAPTQQPSNTTVVVQDRRPDVAVGGGAGDFAMGMLVGGAVGATWGRGFGWGGGMYPAGGYHSGPTVQDTDIHINNYYDVDNTVINNQVDIDASQDVVMQDNIIAGDVGGDFDAADMGGDFDCTDFGGF